MTPAVHEDLSAERAVLGAILAVCARDAGELDRARADLAGRGARVLTVVCDVTDPAQVNAMVRTITDRLGRIDASPQQRRADEVGVVAGRDDRQLRAVGRRLRPHRQRETDQGRDHD